MNQEAINRDLRENSESQLQGHLRSRLRRYIELSSSAMSKYYARWDEAENIYRAWRPLDKEDAKAKQKGKTPKIIVPVSYAQQQAFLSFIMSAFTQREYFYELRGSGPEDIRMVEGLQRDLQYQLDRQQFNLKLYYMTLYSTKFGLCVMKNSWETEKSKVRTSRQVQQSPSMFTNLLEKIMGGSSGPVMTTIEEIGEVISYEGNKLEVISPYSFLPDPSIPVAEFQLGEFVGHEAEYGRVLVNNKEGEIYFGTDKISKLGNTSWDSKSHRRTRGDKDPVLSGLGSAGNDPALKGFGGNDIEPVGNVVLSEFIFRAVPKELSKATGVDCGNDTVSRLYIAVLANDQKIIRFEEYNYLHEKFGYAVGEYSPDHNSFINPGLSETIQELQAIISWLFSSHIHSVETVIKNRFFADTSRVDPDALASGATVIPVKGASNLDNLIKQITVSDVTQGHVVDAERVHQLVQLVTGINENALGQYASGRRSATEARNVNSSAAARLKMHAQLYYSMCYEPLGRLMLSNTRQGRTKAVYDYILGESAVDYPFEQVILSSADKIVGGYDFIPYDPLMPSDREGKAIMLKEVFSMLVQNPNTIQLLNINPIKLLDYIATLLGIRNLKDFSINNVLPQTQVVPDAEAQNLAQSGAQPVDMTGEGLLRESIQ